MQRKAVISLIAVFVVGLGVALWATNTDDVPAQRPQFERSSFILTRADGTRFPFKAEVARSEEEQAYGLMFVRSMPDDEGMIFLLTPPRQVAFWMKNTFISLDMIFVRPNGTIESIAADRRPEDGTPVYSQGLVSAVIEINGGLAKKYGLEPGNKVEIPQ
jgi:uncharacterized protein